MSFCHALSRSSLLARDGDKHGADGVVLRISVQFFVFICANFTALSPAASSLTDHYTDPIRNHVKEGAIYIAKRGLMFNSMKGTVKNVTPNMKPVCVISNKAMTNI